jgi:chromosome partitioning protein
MLRYAPHMVIVSGGIKGGSGKSTAATHLAALAAGRGMRTILLDADKQASSSDFHQLRTQFPELANFTCARKDGPGVLPAARDFAQLYDVVIVDAGGHDSPAQRAALLAADAAWFPVVPAPFDLWTLEPLLAMLSEIWASNPKLRAYTYINRMEARSRFNDSTREELVAYSMRGLLFSGVSIGRRSAFVLASGMGHAVHEQHPQDSKAVAEMSTLFDCVFATQQEHSHAVSS